jgi:hypothetical protein
MDTSICKTIWTSYGELDGNNTQGSEFPGQRVGTWILSNMGASYREESWGSTVHNNERKDGVAEEDPVGLIGKQTANGTGASSSSDDTTLRTFSSKFRRKEWTSAQSWTQLSRKHTDQALL